MSGGRKTTLGDFSDGSEPEAFDKPPNVILNNAYTEPIRLRDSGQLVGYTGIDTSRGRSFIAKRSHRRHYFEKYEGYAINTHVLAQCQHKGVDYILIWEADKGTTHVFTIDQYLNGSKVPIRFSDGETQKIIPLTDAIGIWNQPYPVLDQR